MRTDEKRGEIYAQKSVLVNITVVKQLTPPAWSGQKKQALHGSWERERCIRLHRAPLPEYPSLIVETGRARGSGRRCAGGLGRAGAAPW